MRLQYVFTFSDTKTSMDVGINKLEDIVLCIKPEVVDKNIMTDEFYHLRPELKISKKSEEKIKKNNVTLTTGNHTTQPHEGKYKTANE